MRNKPNKCIYKYVNLLYKQRSPYVFRPHIVVIFREVLFEGYITQNAKTMYKYKVLRFK